MPPSRERRRIRLSVSKCSFSRRFPDATTLHGTGSLAYAASTDDRSSVHPTPARCHDGEALWSRRRTGGDRREPAAQATADRLTSWSSAGAESDAERPTALRILVAVHQFWTH